MRAAQDIFLVPSLRIKLRRTRQNILTKRTPTAYWIHFPLTCMSFIWPCHLPVHHSFSDGANSRLATGFYFIIKLSPLGGSVEFTFLEIGGIIYSLFLSMIQRAKVLRWQHADTYRNMAGLIGSKEKRTCINIAKLFGISHNSYFKRHGLMPPEHKSSTFTLLKTLIQSK